MKNQTLSPIKINLSILFIAVLIFASCDTSATKVDPDDDTSGFASEFYIAMDPDGGLKSVSFADSIIDDDSVLVYLESGIDVVWELEVIFDKHPWRPLYMNLYSESIRGIINWDDDHVVGEGVDENGDDQSIDATIDEVSIHAWFLQAAFLGYPFEDEESFMEFEVITPQFTHFPYKAEHAGTEGVGTTERWINCYKLEIDGRGVYAPFTPNVRVFYRIEEPHIPIQLWVEDEGAVFEWFADSI